MQWWKKLSLSDARQETQGGPMPFRFTSENCPGDYITWFRYTFFQELAWNNITQGDHQIEEAHVNISVNIDGENLGLRTMRVTHDEQRQINKRAPATHMNFDEETAEYLKHHDMTGNYIIFSKDSTGGFDLIIQEDTPDHIG